jgi:hypothetical protein
MTRRQSFLAYAALLLSVVVLASSLTRPSIGQRAIAAQPVVCRYQIATSSSSSGAANVFVIDTATGKVWRNSYQSDDWAELKPLPPTK